MKLVILGAGASYDAFYWYRDINTFKHWRAPLANEIFEQRPEFLNIIDSYPGSHNIFSQIGTQGDIEAFFQDRYSHSKNHKNINVEKQLINVKFFLQHMFSTVTQKLAYAGNSNLTKLVSIIDDYTFQTGEDVLIVSFNYDLLMEDALKELYYGSRREHYELSDYLGHKIKLVKPHGSCNWHKAFSIHSIKPEQGESISQHLYANNFSQEKIDKILEPMFYRLPYNAATVHKGVNNNLYLFPQIHIPLKEKDEFTMPKEQEKYLYDYLPKVTDMLIIGWKGSELHFNRELKKHLGDKKIRIQVVNGPEDHESKSVLDNLGEYLNTSNAELFKIDCDLRQLKWKKEYLDFLLRYKKTGSLTSFLINIEQKNIKSIFNV